MNTFILLPSKVKIRKCPSYFPGFFIILEWHLCVNEIMVFHWRFGFLKLIIVFH